MSSRWFRFVALVTPVGALPVGFPGVAWAKEGALAAPWEWGGDRFVLVALVALGGWALYSTIRLVRQKREFDSERQALRDGEERWKYVLEGACDGVWDWNVGSGEVYFSPRWKEMFGCAQGEIDSSLSDWIERVHPDDRERVKAELDRRATSGEQLTSHEYRMTCKNGEYKWVLERGEVVKRLPDGRPARIIGTHTDITEPKRTEGALNESYRDYRLFADYTNDWETWMDADGSFRHVSPSCQEITGYPREMFRDNPDFIETVIHEEDRPRYRAHTEQNHRVDRKETHASIQFRIVHKNGSIRWIDHNCQPVFDERGVWRGTRGSNRDITDLVQTRLEAEEATKLKDRFVGIVAHDLRSPFTSMLGLLRIVADRIGPLVDRKDREILERIVKTGDGLVETIGDVLNISRLKTGQIVPEPRFFNVASLFAEAITTTSSSAMVKGVTVTNALPDTLRWYADATLMRQVAINLLTNAIKFCSAGDQISIALDKGDPNGVVVADTGAGVPTEILPYLFSIDVKTTTIGTEGERGTGLGLPYCHDVMKAHGGEIRVDSEEGKGARFTLSLPVTIPRALIVDDDPTMRTLAKMTLEKMGFAVEEASDGVEALNAVGRSDYHLLLTDIAMPNMDGGELIARLRADRGNMAIAIFVMTSFQKEFHEAILRLGIDDFMEKPVNQDDFILRVRRLFD